MIRVPKLLNQDDHSPIRLEKVPSERSRTGEDDEQQHGIREPGSGTLILPDTRPKYVSSGHCDSKCWLHEVSQLATVKDQVDITLLEKGVLSPSTEANSKLYGYLKPWQTRLIALNHGPSKSPLSCDLVETNIIDGQGFRISGTSTVVRYEALSYSWGYGDLDHYILCNGQKLAIPGALAIALIHLRMPSEKRYLWCDAICMNQSDLQEKAIQVGMMFRIFEKADRVIAWLGTPSSSPKLLVQSLKCAVDDKRYPLWYWRYHHFRCHEIATEVRTAISNLMQRQWFLRTWVRQEVYAAKELVVQLGEDNMAFDIFLERIRNMDKVFCLMNMDSPSIHPPQTLNILRKEYQHSGADRTILTENTERQDYTSYWLQTLLAGSRFQVSDEKDRVYGALGVLMNSKVGFITRAPANVESMAEGFPVDYSKSISEVYQDVTKFLINATQTLEILEFFTGCSKDVRTSTGLLPNWAEDWGFTKGSIGFRLPIDRQRKELVRLLEQDYTKPSQLRLAGIVVATQLSMLDRAQEISHPRDRFSPRYRRSILFDDLLREPRRRTASQKLRLPSRIDHPPYAFVFTRVDETLTSFELKHEVIPSTNFPSEFADHLASKEYVFGYARRYTGDDILGIEPLHLILPVTASLKDMVVALHGSSCLHLVRPESQESEGFMKCQYIAPVAAIICGHEDIANYSAKSREGSRTFSKPAKKSSLRHTTFILT